MQATRRDFLIGTGLIAAAAPFPAFAQDSKLRFSAVFSEQDIRAEMMKMFAEEIKGDFAFEGYYGGTLFKQGTELVALQRGNLEMGNIAPQDISKQVPAWSVVTSAYLFRDAAHLKTFFNSEPGAEMKKMAEDQLGIHILGPTYFGTRQVGLKPAKKINTPADMAGIKLRMPNGDAWQFLGTVARRQSGADGLCRGLYRPADRRDRRAGQPAAQRREHEVLRGHVADRADLAPGRLRHPDGRGARSWDGMSADQQAKFQAAADKAIAFSTEKHLAREKELVDLFKGKGLDIYTPDVEAFRKHAQEKYLASDLAKDWPAGMVDKINAL